MDATLAPILGPFAYALFRILGGTEKRREDKIQAGEDLINEQPSHPLGVFCCSFVVFRGGSFT